MKEITLRIPEDHKAVVMDRIKTAKSEDMVSWGEVRKRLIFEDEA